MRTINRLVIPGFYGSTDIDEITGVHIDENYINISWEHRTFQNCNSQCLMKGDYVPDFIKNATGDDYQPSHALSESDFEQYKKSLQKLIKINIIDPLLVDRIVYKNEQK